MATVRYVWECVLKSQESLLHQLRLKGFFKALNLFISVFGYRWYDTMEIWKWMANLLKFFPCVVEKSCKTDCGFLPFEKMTWHLALGILGVSLLNWFTRQFLVKFWPMTWQNWRWLIYHWPECVSNRAASTTSFVFLCTYTSVSDSLLKTPTT